MDFHFWDAGATASQIAKRTGAWDEREREDWNEWKEQQDDELEQLYVVEDEDDLVRGRRTVERDRPPAGISLSFPLSLPVFSFVSLLFTPFPSFHPHPRVCV